MTSFRAGLQLLLVLVLACVSTGISGFESNSASLITRGSPMKSISICFTSSIFRIRGGEAISIGKRKKQKPTFVYMVKAFFSSMVDPSYGGEIEVQTDKQKKAAKAKGKKNKLGTGPFGMAGPTGGSFGAVCGPGGCK